jgi:tRNA (cmo5U34)-methyltransferase
MTDPAAVGMNTAGMNTVETNTVGMNTARDVWTHIRLAARDSRCRAERVRVPEPMVIEDPAEVRRFGEGGATQPAMRSVYDFNARALSALTPEGGRVLDLGVGAGQALAHFLRGRPDVTAVGVDLSPTMLAVARDTFEHHAVAVRVRLVQADIGDLPPDVSGERFDTVATLWTLHQLPDNSALSAVLRRIAALREEHGSAVWLLDFQRLADPRTFPDLLTATEPGYPARLRADAVHSESAAFTADELRGQLQAAGLSDARRKTSRPLRMLHAAWLPAARRAQSGAGRWTAFPLDPVTRRKAALLQRAFGASAARPFPPRSTQSG